jgi:hypothetical protein
VPSAWQVPPIVQPTQSESGTTFVVQEPNSTSPYLILKYPLMPQPAPQLFLAIQACSASFHPTIKTK